MKTPNLGSSDDRFPEPSASQAGLVGQQLGDYEIEREIGRGGMGVVYAGRHKRLNVVRAIKVLPETLAGPRAIERFWREARKAAELDHANIVRIIDAKVEENHHYIVMEYIDGCTLEQVYQQHEQESPGSPFPWQEAVRLVRPVLDALAVLHGRGLIHRDVKPSNIMLVRESKKVVLMDFGLVHDAAEPGLTVPGGVLGTPAFMSPEQARGDKVDSSTDCYAVGATLYFLLTGALPFRGSKMEILARLAAGEEPPPVAPQRPDIPADVCAVVHKAMQRRVLDRFPDAAGFAEALEHVLDRHAVGMTAGLGSRTKQASGSHDGFKVDPNWHWLVDRKNQYGVTTERLISITQRTISKRALAAVAFGAKGDGLRHFQHRLRGYVHQTVGVDGKTYRASWAPFQPRDDSDAEVREISFEHVIHTCGMPNFREFVADFRRGVAGRRILTVLNHAIVGNPKVLNSKRLFEYLDWWNDKLVDEIDDENIFLLLAFYFEVPGGRRALDKFEKTMKAARRQARLKHIDVEILLPLDKLDEDDLLQFIDDHELSIPEDRREEIAEHIVRETGGQYERALALLELIVHDEYYRLLHEIDANQTQSAGEQEW